MLLEARTSQSASDQHCWCPHQSDDHQGVLLTGTLWPCPNTVRLCITGSMTSAEIQVIYRIYIVTIFMVMSLDLTIPTPKPSEFVDLSIHYLLPGPYYWTLRYLSLVKLVMTLTFSVCDARGVHNERDGPHGAVLIVQLSALTQPQLSPGRHHEQIFAG